MVEPIHVCEHCGASLVDDSERSICPICQEAMCPLCSMKCDNCERTVHGEECGAPEYHEDGFLGPFLCAECLGG